MMFIYLDISNQTTQWTIKCSEVTWTRMMMRKKRMKLVTKTKTSFLKSKKWQLETKKPVKDVAQDLEKSLKAAKKNAVKNTVPDDDDEESDESE